jgi:hypothetical protein
MTETATKAQVIVDRIQAEGIVERVNGYLSSGLRVMRLSAETGVPVAKLERLLAELNIRHLAGSEWFVGPDVQRYLISLEKWLEEEAEAESQELDDHANTEILRQVYGILDVAHRSRSLVAITGPYGIGKTHAAQAYARDNPRRPNEPGAVWFEFPPGTKGDAGVLDAILSALDPYGHPSGSVLVKLDRVLSLLKPGDFLIADECGIPAEKGSGLKFIGYIHERARIPAAMIGNPSFHAAVWGKRNDYDALASRTRHTSLDGSSAGDVEAFMDWRKLSGRRLKETILAVVRQPGRDGGLRAAVAILDELRVRDMEISYENFLSIAKLLGRIG